MELYRMLDFRLKFFIYQLIYTFIYKYELSPMSWALLTAFCLLFIDIASTLFILENYVSADFR